MITNKIAKVLYGNSIRLRKHLLYEYLINKITTRNLIHGIKLCTYTMIDNYIIINNYGMDKNR